MYMGTCRPMKTFFAGTLAATSTEPEKAVTFKETVHGPVSGTVTVGGKPYAVSNMRSTRGRESIGGFIGSALNSSIRSQRDFRRAAGSFGFTFNLFYVDHRDIAFFSTGRLPIRAPGTNPSLPTLGTGEYDWRPRTIPRT
jgi:acyl-homoserine lactone acylase PvdQ